MVADPQRTRIRLELKWLNAHLGAVRDLDVAVVRLGDRPKATAANAGLSTLQREARHGHTRLARTLRSAKYRRLVNDTSAWIENGSWSTEQGNGAERVRALPIAAFSSHKLAQWKHKLVKKSRKLMEMEPEDDIGCVSEARSSPTPSNSSKICFQARSARAKSER